MSRRGFIPKREVLPDPVYGSIVVTKLINQVMYDGKRGTAQEVCYEAFETVAQKTNKDAMEVFQAALNNILPMLEVKARRVGGSTYQVPMEIRPERRQTVPYFQEDFLKQVVGVFMTAQEMPDMPVEPFAVGIYYFLESPFLLSCLVQVHYLIVGQSRVVFPKLR